MCTAASVLLLNSAKHLKLKQTFPTDIQLFKVNYGNTDTIWEIYSKLVKKDKRTSLTSFWCLYCWNWTDFDCWFWNKTPKNWFVWIYYVTTTIHFNRVSVAVNLMSSLQNISTVIRSAFILLYNCIRFKIIACSGEIITNGSIFYIPANICLFKFNNRNTRKKYEICSKLTIKTPERRHWCRSRVFIVNFEHISPLFLVFLLLTLNK